MKRASSPINAKDVEYLRNSFIAIGSEIEETPVTGITKDEQTGEIKAVSIDSVKPIAPMGILQILGKTSVAPEGYFNDQTHKEVAYKNIRTVAGLGALALGNLIEEGKEFSKTRLATIQKTIDDIHVDMYVTNLSLRSSKIFIPNIVESLAYINSVVYRTWAKRQFAEEFETED